MPASIQSCYCSPNLFGTTGDLVGMTDSISPTEGQGIANLDPQDKPTEIESQTTVSSPQTSHVLDHLTPGSWVGSLVPKPTDSEPNVPILLSKMDYDPKPDSRGAPPPTPEVPANVDVYPSSKVELIAGCPKTKNAWVLLCMCGDKYTAGVLAMAHSLRMTQTKHDIAVMVTDDVSADAIHAMLRVCAAVYRVPYLRYLCKELRTVNQQRIYNKWANVSFTKWNAFALTAYERIMFVDADKVALRNIDVLFKLHPPAGTFGSPFLQLNQSNQSSNYSGPRSSPSASNAFSTLSHGAVVDPSLIDQALHQGGAVAVGTMILLAPNADHYALYQREMINAQPFGFQNCFSMMDEQSLAWFTHSILKQQWRMIHPAYNAIPWYPKWLKGAAPAVRTPSFIPNIHSAMLSI